MNIKNMTKISLFTAITVICAQISIPIGAIPFTLHTFAFFLSASVLGLKNSVFCIFIYMLLGILGLPVFSGFRSGIGVIFGPTGGYIWGGLISSVIIGFVTERFKNSLTATILSMIFGLFICYAVGSIQYVLLYSVSLKTALITCILPFIPADTVKIIAAAILSIKIKNTLHF